MYKWDTTLTDYVPSHRGRFSDITGFTNGLLTALYPIYLKDKNQVVWKFKCECGNEVEVVGSKVVSGYKLSCGCTRKGKKHFGWAGYEDIPENF